MISDEQRGALLDSIGFGLDLAKACKAAKVKLAEALADAEIVAAVEASMAPAPVAAERVAQWAEVAAASKVAQEASKPAPRASAAGLPPVRRFAEGESDTIGTIATEAARLAPGALGYLLWLDDRCAANKLGAMSPYWRWSVGEFYRSGKRWGIWCVGRGGGKSRTLQRVAASDSYLVHRMIDPGETWVYPFISVGPEDANRRVRGIVEVYRRALGLPVIGDDNGDGGKVRDGVKVAFSPRAHIDMLDAYGNSIQLASLASTIGNVSGPSTIGVIIDEAAKLMDRSEHVNPLTEIVTSLAGTFRARPNIRGIVCSSPMRREGAHFEMVEGGDTITNYVARIGEAFVDDARRGLEIVAAWEAARGEADAAKRIREYAATVTAETRSIPTWVGNPTLGHPEALPWDGAALASRIEIEVIPQGSDRLEGLTRAEYWLRENCAVPIDAAAHGGVAASEQIRGIAERRRETPARDGGLLTWPGLPSWDPRSDRRPTGRSRGTL